MPGMKNRSGVAGKTVARHKQEGIFRPDRHAGYTNPVAPPRGPDPPADLTGVALKEWKAITEELTTSKVISQIDRAVLIRYCKLWARAEAISHALAGAAFVYEDVTVDGSGMEHRRLAKHPLLVEARQLDLAIKAYLVELGVTPGSRGRIRLPEKSSGNAFAAFGAPSLDDPR